MNAQDMTDEEFLALMKHHPELWEDVMQILRSPPKEYSAPAVSTDK